MKKKIFLLTATLSCIVFVSISFAFMNRNKTDVTQEFIDAYYDLTISGIEYADAKEAGSSDTIEKKEVLYSKLSDLQQIDHYLDQLNEASANGFIIMPTIAYHNPYSTCVYYCQKQYVQEMQNCPSGGGCAIVNNSTLASCLYMCKYRFITEG